MKDRELIERLGGTAAVAVYLGTSYQRVYNWTTRGIPPAVKLEHPELFLSDEPPVLPRRKRGRAMKPTEETPEPTS